MPRVGACSQQCPSNQNCPFRLEQRPKARELIFWLFCSGSCGISFAVPPRVLAYGVTRRLAAVRSFIIHLPADHKQAKSPQLFSGSAAERHMACIGHINGPLAAPPLAALLSFIFPLFSDYCRQTGRWPNMVTGWDPQQETKEFCPYMPVRNVTDGYPPPVLAHGRLMRTRPLSRPR